MNLLDIKDFTAMADAIVGMDTFNSNLRTRIPAALNDTTGIVSLIRGTTAVNQSTLRSHVRELLDLQKMVLKMRKYSARIIDAFPQRDTFANLATFIDVHGKFFMCAVELLRRLTSFRASLYVQGGFFYAGPLANASMKALDLYIARFHEHYASMTVALRSQRGLTRARW
jgi:hypothetical protein